MENFHIDENYIKQERVESPTEVFNTHLILRDDDPNEEIQGVLKNMHKEQPDAIRVTQEVIQNFILDAFDEGGNLFRDSQTQAGTMINTVYCKLREVAYKNFLKEIKTFDANTRANAKIYFIHKVDGEIFDRVRNEAVYHYKEQLSQGLIPLPDEIKAFEKLIKKFHIKEKLYQCIAAWYVEAEVSIDIIRRIHMYGIFEGTREQAITDKLKKAWELKSNYYIDIQAAFLSMICYLGTKLLSQFQSGIFQWSKVTIMMKVIYFIIFRSAISTPLIATALISSLGSVFITTGLGFIFRKIGEYQKMREVELAFRDFQVITSNLTWDNEELQRLLLDAAYFKEMKSKTQYLSTAKVIETKLHEMIEGNDKYRDGTIVKQFDEEDAKLKSIAVKDVKEEGLQDWIEVTIETDQVVEEKLPIPPVL